MVCAARRFRVRLPAARRRRDPCGPAGGHLGRRAPPCGVPSAGPGAQDAARARRGALVALAQTEVLPVIALGVIPPLLRPCHPLLLGRPTSEPGPAGLSLQGADVIVWVDGPAEVRTCVRALAVLLTVHSRSAGADRTNWLADTTSWRKADAAAPDGTPLSAAPVLDAGTREEPAALPRPPERPHRTPPGGSGPRSNPHTAPRHFPHSLFPTARRLPAGPVDCSDPRDRE